MRARRFLLGAGDDGRVLRVVRQAGEPLASVDHPLVAVEDRGRLELRGVGRRDRGLGHPEALDDVAVDERPEVTVAPLGRGELVQHQRVLQGAGAEHPDRGLRETDDLVDVDVVEERHASAADLLRVTDRPETLGLGLGAQLGHEGGTGIAGDPPRVHLLLARDDPLLHELEEPVADRADVLGNGKIHARVASPLDGHGKGFRTAQRSAAGRAASTSRSSTWRVRSITTSRATRISWRPSQAPRQKCSPRPKVSISWGRRSRSKRSGSGEHRPDRARRRRTSTPVGASGGSSTPWNSAPSARARRGRLPTGGSQRSASSIAQCACLDVVRTRSMRCGSSSRAKNSRPMLFVVLWVPAGNSSRRNDRISSSSSVRPWNSPLTNVLIRSSAGTSRRSAMTGSRNAVSSALAAQRAVRVERVGEQRVRPPLERLVVARREARAAG